ncbi:MAG: hypothetical protein R3F39_10370 [Myxococcota bacterium]
MSTRDDVLKSSTTGRWLRRLAWCALLGGVWGAGCDSGGSEAGEEGTPLEEACEHMAEGPFVNVQATLDAASAPPANLAHTAMKVQLVESGGMYEGYVSFPAAMAAETVFFLGAGVPFAVSDSQGAPLSVESSDTAITACSEVAAAHTFDLTIGTWWLRLGPTAEPSVQLVVEAAGAAHAHE